jgi:hypothetical protein
MHNNLVTIDLASLDKVTGAGRATGTVKTGGSGLSQGMSHAWTNTKSFVGGMAGGAIHGVNAKDSQIGKFADTSNQWTKHGFEVGAMGNMAAGPVGDLVSAGAGVLNPGD